jgi:hypothetical protein
MLRNLFGCTWWYHKVTRLKWKLILVHAEIVLILTQDRCMVCVKRTIGSEIILEAPCGTLRWHGSCGISLLSLSRQSYCQCKNPMVLLSDIGHTSLEIILDAPDGTPKWLGSSESLVHLKILLFLMQDRCIVCVDRTIGLKIVWTHPMELLGDVGHVDSCFFLFEDSVSVGAT